MCNVSTSTVQKIVHFIYPGVVPEISVRVAETLMFEVKGMPEFAQVKHLCAKITDRWSKNEMMDNIFKLFNSHNENNALALANQFVNRDSEDNVAYLGKE